MGAFSFLKSEFEELLKKEIGYIGRDRSASPAAGSFALHQKQQALLMKQAVYEH